MRSRIFYCVIFFLFSVFSFAQNEKKIWHFGPNATGMLFDANNNITTNTSFYTPYTNCGSSVATDPISGNLLFYTDGKVILDKFHVAMPNGSGLTSGNATHSSGWVVSDPADCNKYYVFSISTATDAGVVGNLYYSKVDMSLPGNGTIPSPRGNVITGQKNVLVASSIAEGMQIIQKPNSHDYWLFVADNSPASIRVFLLNTTGITLQSTFNFTVAMADIQAMRYCPVNQKLFVGSLRENNVALLLDFNPISGILSNQFSIPGTPFGTSTNLFAGVIDGEWSADGTKLYISKYRGVAPVVGGGKLYQYDMNNPGNNPVLIYDVSINDNTSIGKGLRRGPDDKIYYCFNNSVNVNTKLGVINSPNLQGASCNFVFNQVNFSPQYGNGALLPHFLQFQNSLPVPAGTTYYYSAPACLVDGDTAMINMDTEINLVDNEGDNLLYTMVSSGANSYITGNLIHYIKPIGSLVTDTITVSVCDDYCYALCDTFKLVIQFDLGGTNSLNLPAQYSACSGDTIIIDGGVNGLNYSWSTGETTQTINVTTATTIQVEATDAGGCIYRDTVSVVFNPNPSINLGVDTSYCDNSNYNHVLSATGFASVLWSDGSSLNTLSVTAPGLYSVEVENVFGCSDTDSIVISEFISPIADLGPDAISCVPVQLSVSGAGLTVVWNGSTVASSISVAPGGTYFVEVTDINGCSDIDSITVSFGQALIPDLGPDTSYCDNLSFNEVLSVSGYTSVLWSDGSSQDSLNVNGSGVYFVVVQDANFCVASDTISISEFIAPAVDLGADIISCDPFLLSTSGSGLTVVWNGSIIGNSITASTSGLYYVEVTDANGCSDTDSINVTISQLTFPDLGPDTSYCDNISFNQVLSVSGFNSVLWSDGSSQNTLSVNSPGTYYVTVQDVNGCSDSDTILISEFIAPVVDLGNDTSGCNSVVLSVNGNGLSVLWNGTQSGNTFIVTNTGDQFVMVTDQNGCSDADTVNVQITNGPSINLGPDTSFCGNTAFVHTLFANGFNSVSWSDGSSGNSFIISNAGTFWVTVSDASGCSDADSVVVTALSYPIVNLGQDFEGCPQTLTAATSNSQYLWSDGSTGATLYVDSSGTYSVLVMNGNGCIGSDTIDVIISGTAGYFSFIPNVFSPNGDGINDVFKIEGLMNECSDQLHVEIYNRWGQLMFNSDDPAFEWKGKTLINTDATAGVYYVLLQGTFGSIDITRHHTVTLVR